MSHTQYAVERNYEALPMERLLYISSSTYGKDWVSTMHSHSFTELFYVVNGKGHFCTESGEVPIQKDSLIIINPNVRHTEKSSSTHPLTYIALGIDCLKFELENDEHDYMIYDFTAHQSALLPIMRAMLQEVEDKKASFDLICQNYLSILLLKLSRLTKKEFIIATPEDCPSECELIRKYINQHSIEPLTLDDLANVSHLNKFYLSHIFSKAYGISPINYLLERRILHSKELLKTTDYSITRIAHATGFSSSNYFSQAFKKYMGITPKAYRLKHKADNKH